MNRNPSSLPSFQSMKLENMEIGSTTFSHKKSNSTNSFFNFCWRLGRYESGEDWEWMEYFGLEPEYFCNENIFQQYAAGMTISRQKWVARMIEGIVLSMIVILVIVIAAFDPL